MKIKKSKISPFFKKIKEQTVYKKLFTINDNNKGIIRGFLLGATIIYIISPTNIITQTSTKEGTIITKRNKTIISENLIKDSKNQEIIIKEIQKKQKTNIELLSEISEEDLQKYILKQIDKTKEEEINRLILEEAKKDKYKIKEIPNEISTEITKSAILYQLSFKEKKRMFAEEENLEQRIANTTALLASVAKLETGSFKFDHREFSSTGAYGRFQIIATTASNIILKLYFEENFKIQEKEKQIQSNVYNMLKIYTKEQNKKYSEKYSEKWNINNEHHQLKRYLSYTRRLNFNYIKALETSLAHMKTKEGKRAEQVKKELFFSKDNKLSKYKQFKFSLKVLDFLKNPENQGILACFVLEDIYKRILKKYPEKDMEEILYITLKKYNNDKKISKYKGKKMEIRKIYATKGISFFKNNIKKKEKNKMYISRNDKITTF